MSNNLQRFLSRREKKPGLKSLKSPDHFGGIFAAEADSKRKIDKEEGKSIKTIIERLRHYGIDTMVEANVEYALRAPGTNDDPEAAFKLLILLQDTYEGIVKQYKPEVKLIGAQNREGVTCYLDALLFAMFARLDSFEALLYDSFQDLPRKKLAGLLRLWVNMLRDGRLITVDVTKRLQEALAECGWQDASKLKQQDPSEAFTFITGQLELPLLTLKMDLYHTGKEDPQDDHKFVNERLLEVAIADQPRDGEHGITLEACLEQYFNNRIEVKRHIENMRRNTLKSGLDAGADHEHLGKVHKESGSHVEVVEMDSPETPLTESPRTATFPQQSKDPIANLRPGIGRLRADSIFSQRKATLDVVNPLPDKLDAESYKPVDGESRKSSLRTEVLMPAWQFFKLLPWYTDHMPDSDAQVAAHFSTQRPVLGICLKRYSFTVTGQALRLHTYVDIPLEIAVPNFVGDDSMHDDSPLVGNFRLMLQSVVCHRGVSVHSGHYVTLCRGPLAHSNSRCNQTDRDEESESGNDEDPWMRFDDLAKHRVTKIDIREALREETPYLLFYQVQPIGDDGRSIHDLPSYAEATSRSDSNVELQEKAMPWQPLGSEHTLPQSILSSHTDESRTDTTVFAPQSGRNSLDANVAIDNQSRGRSSISVSGEERPGSVVFQDSSLRGSTTSVKTDPTSTSRPSTPPDEKTGGFLAVASKIGSKRGSRRSKSRPVSAGLDNSSRFSLNMNMTKLARGLSSRPETSTEHEPEFVPVNEKALGIVSTLNLHNPDISPEDVDVAQPALNSRTDRERRKRKEKKTRLKPDGSDDRDCVIM